MSFDNNEQDKNLQLNENNQNILNDNQQIIQNFQENQQIIKQVEEDSIERLERGINTRDQQMAKMLEMEMELLQQLQEAEVHHESLEHQAAVLESNLKNKNKELDKILQQKELNFQKLQAHERENEKIKVDMKKFGYQEGFLNKIFQPFSNKEYKSQNYKKLQEQKIQTSKDK